VRHLSTINDLAFIQHHSSDMGPSFFPRGGGLRGGGGAGAPMMTEQEGLDIVRSCWRWQRRWQDSTDIHSSRTVLSWYDL